MCDVRRRNWKNALNAKVSYKGRATPHLPFFRGNITKQQGVILSLLFEFEENILQKNINSVTHIN